MKTSRMKKAAAAACIAAFAYASPATATIIDVFQGLALNSVYGSNSGSVTYSSLFDAGAVLGTTNIGASYTINSATLHFTWADNSDDPYSLTSSTPMSHTYGEYDQDGNSKNYKRKGIGTASNTYATPGESAAITLGSKMVNSSTTALNSTTKTIVETSYRTVDNRDTGDWYRYYTNNTDTTTSIHNDYTGAFFSNIDLLALGGTALTTLLADGVLNFGMTMYGSALLTGATLELDVSQPMQAASAAVPEPASVALLGIGLVGMATIRRRRQ